MSQMDNYHNEEALRSGKLKTILGLSKKTVIYKSRRSQTEIPDIRIPLRAAIASCPLTPNRLRGEWV